jgi:UDP-N-acetylmuramate dehydrogenase
VFDRVTKTTERLTAEACEFAYRTSRFKASDAGRFVVCEVTFRLRPGSATITYPDLLKYLEERGTGTTTLDDARNAVLAVRRSKGMVLDAADVDTRSVGSFFTNPVVAEAVVLDVERQAHEGVPTYPAGPGRVKVPAAWLLERAGVGRGYGTGAVGLSGKHPLAVINRGGASARAVVTFAADIKRRVAERFGVSLVPEPTFLGFGDDEEVGYLVGGHDGPRS